MTLSEWRLKMSENGIAAKLKGIEGAADAASSSFTSFQNKMNSVKTAMIGAFSVTAVAAMGKEIFSVGSEMEQLNVSFKTMLGSQAAATAMMEDIRKFSATTPFEMPEVAKASKQLLAFGIEQSKVIDSLRMLGDVGSGIGAPIGDLAYLFGTIKTQGRAMTMDINQFANRGIPIWDELSKITGKNSLELRKFVEDGKIGFPQIEKAFANMSGQGGKFFNLMQEQSATSAGKLSNAMDKLKEVMDKLFIKAQPLINNMIEGFGKLIEKIIPAVEWIERNAKTIRNLALAVGAFYIAVKSANFIMRASLLFNGLQPIIGGLGALKWGLIGVTEAQLGLNAAMAVSPAGLYALGVAAVTFSLMELYDAYTAVDRARAKMSLNNSEEEKAKTDALKGIKNQMIALQDKEKISEAEALKKVLKTNKNKLMWDMVDAQKELETAIIKGDEISRNKAGKRKNIIKTQQQLLEDKNLPGLLKNIVPTSNGSTKKDDPFKAAADDISAGGKSVKNITVNIKTLNEGGINISTTKLPEAQSDIERQFMNWFLRAIQGAELAVANE